MATAMLLKLAVQNMYIADDANVATTLVSGKKYHLYFRIRNTDPKDGVWYEAIQCRIVPMNTSVQFFTDFTYTQPTLRFDSPLFMLRSTQMQSFEIPLKWTGNQSVSVRSVKFDVGVYAHQMVMNSAWKKLQPVI